MVAATIAFIAPRLNIALPLDLIIPTPPTDVLGFILIGSGVFWNTYQEVKE
jgi:hypothetical protein